MMNKPKTKRGKRFKSSKKQPRQSWLSKGGLSAKSPFPFRMMCTLNANFQANMVGVGPQFYTLKLNSLYDYDYTAGGANQPYYYDQLAAIYTKYRVYSVELDSTMNNSNITYSSVVSFAPNDSTSNFSNLQQSLEFPGSRGVLLAPAGGGHCVKRLRARYNIAKIMGRDANVDEDLASAVTNNPVATAYLHITVDSQITGNNVGIQNWIHLRFHAVFYEPQLLSVSLTKPIIKAEQASEESYDEQIIELNQTNPQLIFKIDRGKSNGKKDNTSQKDK